MGNKPNTDIKHKNTKHHPVLRPATAEKQARQARHKNSMINTQGNREREREKTRAVWKHVCTHRTNLNIPSTLFFKNSSGYAKHTIKRGGYSLGTFIKHEKPAAKYIRTFFLFFFLLLWHEKLHWHKNKAMIRSMLVSKANENYTSGTDCAIWRWNGWQNKDCQKKKGGKSPQLNHGVNCNCFQQWLKKTGDQRTEPSPPFFCSQVLVFTLHTKRKSKLLR